MLIPLILAILLAAAPAAPHPAIPQPTATPSPTPQRLLGMIRAVFRTHRPPPPYVVYTMTRAQKTEQGYPDYAESYTEHIWVRNSDRAALARRVYRAFFRGDPVFERPAFNEPRDPGPPTADVFEPAPLHPHPVEFVPTPEPSQAPLREIGSVTVTGEFDYRVVSLDEQGELVHLVITPTRDPDRNRLRELWADRKTLELRKFMATDKLFVQGDRIYGVIFMVTLATLEGHPVVTDIHGIVGDNYNGDGQVVDFRYRDISFPKELPAWYFDTRQYKSHIDNPTDPLPI